MTKGNYLGSLAVVRACGRRNQQTLLADPDRVTLTHASRYLGQSHRSPSVREFEAFRDWLIQFGERRPGTVLYSSSDDMTWLIALYRDELSRHFKLYSPDIQTIHSLLNKARLYEMAGRLDIPVPETVSPTSLPELEAVSRELTYPVLIKPRTQAGLLRGTKGVFCKDRERLLKAYPEYLKRCAYHPSLSEFDGEIKWPLVQSFWNSSAVRNFSLTGFVDESQEVFLTRAADKLLQYPLRVGIGICFESRTVHPDAVEYVRRLCKEVGYFGVFEVEFIVENDHFRLTDFNPRYYGQIGFELARELPLDQLVIAGANGDLDTCRNIAENDRSWDHQKLHRYCNYWRLFLLTSTQMMAGRYSRQERRKWLDWGGKAAGAVDPVLVKDDPRPQRADMMAVAANLVRHPRSSFKTWFADF